MSLVSTRITETEQMSDAAEERLRRPLRRGSFRLLDAARRRLALLSVADGGGSARLFWLVDPESGVVEDARFLAFGDLASHPVADAFCELARGRTLAEACALPAAAVETLLRDEPDRPAFAEADPDPLAFLPDLQARALAAGDALEVPPEPPPEQQRYVRKREADWDEADRAWLPLSLMRKIVRVQEAVRTAAAERVGRDLDFSVEGLHDDFVVELLITGVAAEERETLRGFLAGWLRSEVHPAIEVELADG